MIHIDGTTNGTTLTIEKWAKYQGGGTTNGTTNEPTNGTADGTTNGTHTRMYNKNVKEIKEEVAPLPDDEEDPDWDDDEWVDAKDLKLEGEY